MIRSLRGYHIFRRFPSRFHPMNHPPGRASPSALDEGLRARAHPARGPSTPRAPASSERAAAHRFFPRLDRRIASQRSFVPPRECDPGCRFLAEGTNGAHTTDSVLALAGPPARSQTRARLSAVARSWRLRG